MDEVTCSGYNSLKGKQLVRGVMIKAKGDSILTGNDSPVDDNINPCYIAGVFPTTACPFTS